MNIRFGLYFIPENGPFYAAGSSIVGYDVRQQETVAPPDFISPEWIASNSQFGFHATITDAITIPEDKLDHVIEQTQTILRCLKPTNQYSLTKERVGFWRSESNMAVLLMKPNRNVEMLHDVLVSRLHPLGIGSEYFDNYTRNPATFMPSDLNSIEKTKQFFSPYIFDEFVPHFTCINSYGGDQTKRPAIEAALDRVFEDFHEVTFDTITLVVQHPDEEYFRIVREFSLHGE